MATAAQIIANRANACYSTGPRTIAGIESSKHNATRHGLAGKQIVVKGEDPAEYDQLHLELVRDHAPVNEREAMLVEEIAQNWWRLQRARRIETEVLAKFGQLECIIDPEARRAFLTITRYLNTIERTWHRACRDLEKLQDIRRESEPPPALEIAPNPVRRKDSRIEIHRQWLTRRKALHGVPCVIR